MAYKKLIKVSDVCQLLKPNFLGNKTIAGVTVTSNGNTFTLNGTSSVETSISVPIYYITSKGVGHKFLISGCPQGAWSSYSIFFGALNQGLSARDYGNGAIFTATTAGNYVGVAIKKAGITFDNLVFKPQLFDLTEMYGAGHEPTSVEQFRQDFPEEMYDYSPYCWLTSYKRVFMTGGGNYLTSYQRNLTCKTKNLFDINLLKGITYFDVYGNSLKCFKYATSVSDTNVLNVFKSLKPNTIYTMSATVNKYISNATGRISLVFRDGSTFILFKISQPGYYYYRNFSLTQTQIDNISSLIFYGEVESAGGPIIWDSLQLELGDTATDYVPYGHL